MMYGIHKTYLCIISIVLCSMPVTAYASAHDTRDEVVDEILATIYSNQGKEVVLVSDLRPGLDGSRRTLRDVVLDRLKKLDAQALGLEVTEGEADQFIARIQQENNMTREQIENIFSDLGYTYEEGRQILREQQMVERITEHRVKADRRLLIQRADVEAYERQHPSYQQASYQLQNTFIRHDEMSQDAIEEAIANGRIDTIATWEPAFTISEEDLAPEMRFIDDAEPGSIVDVESTEDGTEITRLVDKQERKRIPVEARYDEIAQTLRQQNYATVVSEYHERLLKNATIRFTYSEDRDFVYRDR